MIWDRAVTWHDEWQDQGVNGCSVSLMTKPDERGVESRKEHETQIAQDVHMESRKEKHVNNILTVMRPCCLLLY